MEKEQTNENSWEFHLTDKIAHLSKMTLETYTEFWLSTLQTWFRGYQTPEEYKATIWGREVDLCISIAPLETPTEKLPIIKEKSAKGKNELLPPEQQAYVDELKKKIKALKKLLPPKVDEALEQRYLDYMNAERIKAIIQDCTKIWSNPDLPVEEKISQLIPYKIECLNETIKLIRKQCGKNLEPRCPHESLIRKHLKAISGYMNKLEEEGEAIWQLRMADELLPTANAWREDCELPALSREEFALQVELQSVHIETKEKEDGSIHYELELFFQDTEDTFAGHFLYADIEDHEVKEITLMG